MAAVADAWVRRFDEQGPIGELEVAVSETLARWRVGSIELPDYYLVLDAESWTPTRRHWYLGVLHRAAPARVVPVPNDAEAAGALPRLDAGRWWPDLDELLDRHRPRRARPGVTCDGLLLGARQQPLHEVALEGEEHDERHDQRQERARAR